jgi:uncharacterized Zn finger protein (UPF0148 family)
MHSLRSKLWFCTAQAVHSSVLSDLLLFCPSCGSELLKLYIVLFCPICDCSVRAYSFSSTEPQRGQDNNISDRKELCTAWAVQNHSLDKTIKYCSVRSAMVLSKLWFCTAQAVHRSVLSDLLWSCRSCGSVLLKLYIVLFCPIVYCPVQAVVL